MSESLLKKEFKKRDVERIRNLVKKDYTSRTSIGIGYSKVEEVHKEGDIWEENGKKWTIKNGIKQNITKLDAAKKAVRTPLTCPKCGGPMNLPLHEKMYKIHGFCFDCTLMYEAELRKAGLFKQYEKRMMQGNIKAFLQDLDDWVLDFINTSESYVTEQGDIEEWNNNKTQEKKIMLENIQKYKSYFQDHLEHSS